MKKKKIEAVSFIGLKELVRSKGVLFVGVTAVKKIGEEKILLLEVYKNRAKDKKTPVIRYAASKDDWAVYDTRDGLWSHRKMDSYTWGMGFVWYEDRQPEGRGYNERSVANVLSSEQDLNRIRNFLKRSIAYQNEYTRWFDLFDQHENYCVAKKKQRANDLRNERLKARINAIKPIDEHKIIRYADKELFGEKHYIYYTKKGSRARIACSHCGNVTEGRWRAGDTYESQFENYIPEPVAGRKGKCPVCDAEGIFKAAGRQKHGQDITMHLYLGSKYKETGACIRYIELVKRFQVMTDEKKITEARESMAATEIARIYVDGQKMQIDYHKHNPYIGGDFWDDCNMYGLANINIDEATIHPDTWEELKGTCLQYCAAKEYYAYKGEINFRRYIERYIENPQIEMLVKLKLYDLVDHTHYLNNQGATPQEYLMIRKDRIKYLSQKHGEKAILNVLKLEKRLEQHWTIEQIEKLASINPLNTDNLETVLGVLSVQKLLNYIQGYAGCEFFGCTNARNLLMHTATEYIDYLIMRMQLGYDLHNTVFLHPRNLEEAHRKMVEEVDKKHLDKRILEVNTKYSHIKKEYRKLRRKYYYEDDNYIIRPAKDAGEIVREGRRLHHCVGGDNYLSSHNNDKSYILFLRYKKTAEVPFITIEISADVAKVRQWYGAYDKKPDEANMQKLIDSYVKGLQKAAG